MSQESETALKSCANVQDWSSRIGRVLTPAALVGPLLLIAAAGLVAAGVQKLPGDLDYISEPEGLLGLLAAPFLVATWIQVGRRIAERAVRTAVVVTLLGVVAAIGFSRPFAERLFLADLVEVGLDPAPLYDAIESPTAYSAIAFLPVAAMFLVALIAGVAIVRTQVAPIWAGIAMILFVPLFITAQAAYVAIEVTYPAATILFFVGVLGTVGNPWHSAE